MTVGRYVFEVGAPAGMGLTLAPPSTKTAAGRVAVALAQRGVAQSAPTPNAEPPPEFVDDASRVTDVAERVVRLFGALAGGNAVDPELLGVEIYDPHVVTVPPNTRSLRRFLRLSNVTLNPGIRSLARRRTAGAFAP